MKKVLLSALLVSSFLGNSWATEPLKVELATKKLKSGTPYQVVNIIASDDIIINDVTLNNGDCKIIKGKQEDIDKLVALLVSFNDKETAKILLMDIQLDMYRGTKTYKKLSEKDKKIIDKAAATRSANFIYPLKMNAGDHKKLFKPLDCTELSEVQFVTNKGKFIHKF